MDVGCEAPTAEGDRTMGRADYSPATGGIRTGIQNLEGTVGEKGNVVAAAQATAQDTLGRVTTTVTGVAFETAAMTGDAVRDKAIEHSIDHAIAEVRDRMHDRDGTEQTDPDASPESPAS